MNTLPLNTNNLQLENYLVWFYNNDVYTGVEVSQNKLIFEKIEKFSILKEGWKYGEGNSISEKVIKSTQKLYFQLSIGLNYFKDFKVNALPNANGGIMLSFGVSDNFIELSIKPNLKIDLTHEKGIGSKYDILEEIDDIDISNSSLILTYLYKICNSYEPFTSIAMTTLDSDSLVRPLKTSVVEFQSLRKNVRKNVQELFANISPTSIPILQESL